MSVFHSCCNYGRYVMTVSKGATSPQMSLTYTLHSAQYTVHNAHRPSHTCIATVRHTHGVRGRVGSLPFGSAGWLRTQNVGVYTAGLGCTHGTHAQKKSILLKTHVLRFHRYLFNAFSGPKFWTSAFRNFYQAENWRCEVRGCHWINYFGGEKLISLSSCNLYDSLWKRDNDYKRGIILNEKINCSRLEINIILNKPSQKVQLRR